MTIKGENVNPTQMSPMGKGQAADLQTTIQAVGEEQTDETDEIGLQMSFQKTDGTANTEIVPDRKTAENVPTSTGQDLHLPRNGERGLGADKDRQKRRQCRGPMHLYHLKTNLS